MKSKNGSIVYLYGAQVNGETSARLQVVDEDYNSSMVRIYMQDNSKIDHGDSGAPIYLKNGTNATLLGIHKGKDAGGAWGTSLGLIKDKLLKENQELYVYQKNTDY